MIVVINCHAQRKIKKLEIEEVGFSVNLNFEAISDELKYQDTKLKITPLSTSDLNEKFLNESSFNGKFEYSHYEKSRNSYFLKKLKRKREKSDYEFLVEGVDWLLDNDKVNSEEYNELIKQIILNYDYETGRDLYNADRIISCNPYYIDDKYLNTFEIEITNPTKSFQTINTKLLVESGNMLLYPLSTAEIIGRLEQNDLLNYNKTLTLNRYNLPAEITIPPNSKIIKYFATAPIDYNNNELNIALEGIDTKFKWTVNKQHDSFNEKYIYFECKTDWFYDDYSSEIGDNFYLLKSTDNVYFSNDAAFIGEDNLNEEFELITISLYSDKLYFSRTKFKGIDYIDLSKNRRKEIEIKTTKIDELKKKVKQ
jgi:hypothetical protein